MREDCLERPLRVGLISLGCAKNLVDAEIMLGTLLKDGMELTQDTAQADVVIVNTCSFIDAAQEESVDTILESAEVRDATNRGQGLVVAGCLPQRFRDELPKLLPEVDAFMGIDQVAHAARVVRDALRRRREKIHSPRPPVHDPGSEVPSSKSKVQRRKSADARRASTPSSLIDVTRRPQYIPDYATPRFRLTPPHFAYVKIAEGCNHPCSFCIIPRMRGSHRSRPQGDIVAEARALVAEGVRELNLISQDSTYYGLDLRANPIRAIAAPERFKAVVKSLPAQATTVCSLLRELNTLPGDFWVRLLYTHPAHWTDELIGTIAGCPKIARYIDIPLQHIHENMLERMRRETSHEYIINLLRRIRAGVPGIALRTTFIVGFPGETEEYFTTLLDFIRETKFERLGVFTYSREENTRAGTMAGQIPDEIKRERRDRAMAAQHDVAVAVSRSFVGRTLRVLVESQATPRQLNDAQISSWEHGFIREAQGPAAALKGRFMVARGEADAPDIDGRVYVRGVLPVGRFARVKIVGSTDYDLIGVPA
ncbi:MAG TPA: 30S ribosomal protein S12 methylthiotransferase RimO [Verrucomicrobiae bacterium]